MSDAGLDAAIQSAGGQVIRTDVGDRNVIDENLRYRFNFGGEQSGHLIFREHRTAGDGRVAALQMLRIMRSSGQPVSLAEKPPRYPAIWPESVPIRFENAQGFWRIESFNEP